MANDQAAWVVKGVALRIRQIIKSYAGAHTLTMAEALEFYIDTADEAHEVRRIRWHDARIYFKYAGLPEPTDSEAANLLARAAEIRQQHHDGKPVDITGLNLAGLRFASLIDSVPRGELGPEPPDPLAPRSDDTAEPTRGNTPPEE